VEHRKCATWEVGMTSAI